MKSKSWRGASPRWCCPSSSLHNGYGNLATGMHPELMALGVNVSLGTDTRRPAP